MIRWYILPLERIGNTRLPMYLYHGRYPERGGVRANWSLMDYGDIDVCLARLDVTEEQHKELAEYKDVFAIPIATDRQKASSADLAALADYLEANSIPADWLTVNTDWGTVIRTIAKMCQFMQRLSAIAGEKPLSETMTLDTQQRDMSARKQMDVAVALTSMGFKADNLRDDTTMRATINDAAGQWGSRPILLGGQEL